jgi:hypothetical protein
MIKVIVVEQDNPNFVVFEGSDDESDCPSYRLTVSCAALADGLLTVETEVQGLKDRVAQRVERWNQAKLALSKINP